MDFETIKAIVADAGGWDNVVRLIFDNNIHINFARKDETNLKESDFVNLGGNWVYKEPATFRDNREYDYTVEAFIYNQLECLQAIITSKTQERIDVMSMNDMLTMD